ncbi:MAG TPA: ArsR family transcriptional regulator, partial [Actinomycetota bacterium]|nr:ArsR family transcriptional regulator [Actinomycetota bacterium]
MSSEAARLLGLLAEPDRLKVVAAIVLGSRTVDQIVAATELEPKVVEHALARLTSGGLVTGDRRSLAVDSEELRAAVRSAAEEREAGEKLG